MFCVKLVRNYFTMDIIVDKLQDVVIAHRTGVGIARSRIVFCKANKLMIICIC